VWKVLLQSADQVHWYTSTDTGKGLAVEVAEKFVPWTLMEMMVEVPVVVDDDGRAKGDNNCIRSS
jgi:hypothetical protein